MKTSFKNEQEVAVNLLKPLFEDVLGYPESELEWAMPVKMYSGRDVKIKEADLVAKYNGSPVIAVDAKNPTEAVRSWIGQLDSYAFHLKTPYSVITNGRQLVLRGYYSFNSRINVIDESVEDMRHEHWKKLKSLISFANIQSVFGEKANQVAEPDQEKIQDYRRFFRRIHNEIRDRDKLDPAAAFDELSKLLFLKAAEDEWRQSSKSKSVLTTEKIEEWESLGRGKAMALVNEWFRAATEELFPDVFDDQPRINLSPGTLKAVLEMLRPFHVKDGDVDVKGRAFEEFLPSQLRGKGLGQYFTPRPVVNFMADMAAISIQDVVVDFSCGSGGFLIKAFEQMQRYVGQLPSGILKGLGTTSEKLLDGIRFEQIFGVDAEPRAARTAKMNMLMWGDGRRVVRGNALDIRDFTGKLYEPTEYNSKEPHSGCTLILANPPFGAKEKDQEILKRYALASQQETRKGGRTEVLFVEKGLKLLRPAGKMLIVLPQGLMSGESNARVRDFIHSKAEIRSIISLPTHTFVQSGVPTVNACILYIQKFTNEKKQLYDKKTAGLQQREIRDLLRSDPDFDYPILMATAEYIGYEPSGRMIVKPGEKTDLDEILEDFAKQPDITSSDVDVFEFADTHFGERSFQKKDQTVRGLKTAFVVPLKDTAERLDPPFYFLRHQAGPLLSSLRPLAGIVEERKGKFRPKTDAELDAEYSVLSVSSDGRVTLNELVKGENFKQMKKVHARDIVYNPMRVNIGSIGMVPKALDGGLVSPDYVVFRSTGLDPDFLVMLLRSPFYRLYIDVISTGSIRDRLYFQNLETMRVPRAKKAQQAKVCALAERADEARELLARISSREKARMIDHINQLIKSASLEAGKAPAKVSSADDEKAFRDLAEQWRRGIGPTSSATKMAKHPAYQKIIRMGETAVPYILSELEKEPDHWFIALYEITGDDPVRKNHRGDLERMAADWIAWGRKQGFKW